MAAIAALVDPDPRTGAAFVDAVDAHFLRHFGSAPKGATIGNLACRWWACGSAPVSTAQRETAAIWVLGHLDEIDRPTQSAAEQLADHFQSRGLDGLSCRGGYFLAIIHQKDHYYVLSDRLGFFPCYYASRDGRLLVGTSSDIPFFHPMMPRNLNRKGLVGHLLCMHEVLGEPLWQDCRRLGTGEILHFFQGKAEITAQQSIPVSDARFGSPPAMLLEKSHAAMQDAIRRYEGSMPSLLLSGGLDCRLVAGYLQRAGVHVDTAYTLGSPTDNEFRCAARVCRELRWPQKQIEIDFSCLPSFANRQIITEQAANGLNNPTWWLLEGIEDVKPPLVSGLLGDAVLGGSHILWAYDPVLQAYSFDALFRRVNACGLSSDLICRLLPDPDTPDLIAETVQQLRDLYESLPGHDFQKSWQFDLLHRQRFHVAGVLRRLSFGAWPSAPLAHEALLTLAGGMPACALMDRRLQVGLMIREFPSLAAIPVDANTPHPRPLSPSLGWRIKDKIARRAARIRRVRPDRPERRYYYRIYDINNEGWRRIRDACHEALPALSGILDLDCVRTLVPDGRTTLHVRDPIVDTSGMKSLIAFVLWYRHHFGPCRPPAAV